MHSKLRMYVESLFDKVQRTKEVVELREEILQNVVDKYEDLIREGLSEEEAYRTAISGIGDVDDLLSSMGVKPQEDMQTENIEQYNSDSSMFQKTSQKKGAPELEKEEKKSTYLLCGSIMLYILCVLPVIIGSQIGGEIIGICFMFVMIALATGMVVLYGKTRPRYQKADDSMVESFKEWKNNNEQNREIYKSIRSAIWSVTTALYIIISFMTMAWHVTWVIFLIAGAVINVIKAYYDMKN